MIACPLNRGTSSPARTAFSAFLDLENRGRGLAQLGQAVQRPDRQLLPLGKTDEFPRRQGIDLSELPSGRGGVDRPREGERQWIAFGNPLGTREEARSGDQRDPQSGRAIVLVQLLHDFFRRRTLRGHVDDHQLVIRAAPSHPHGLARRLWPCRTRCCGASSTPIHSSSVAAVGADDQRAAAAR